MEEFQDFWNPVQFIQGQCLLLHTFYSIPEICTTQSSSQQLTKSVTTLLIMIIEAAKNRMDALFT